MAKAAPYGALDPVSLPGFGFQRAYHLERANAVATRMNEREGFGHRVTLARKASQLSMADLEKKSGVPSATICRMENSISPDPWKVGRLNMVAKAMGVPVAWLIGGRGVDGLLSKTMKAKLEAVQTLDSKVT